MNARTRFHPSSFILHPSPGARGKPRRYATALRHSSFIIHHSSFPRNAFTLVEMLVVIVILTMLAGMVMFAIRGAQESARQSKTKATIQKLDSIVVELYESYDTRRVPITLLPGTNPRDAAIARLAGLRDLMRMEMPDRLTDITNGTQYIPTSNDPALHRAYQDRLNTAAGATGRAMNQNASAECLYLIVTLAGGEDARGQFAADEVGDTDSNGLPEFIDGWGRPIFFLRWAPGFNDSDCQCNIFVAQDRLDADREYHDPFDPRRVDNASVGRPAWGLVPLIYSAGRDGQYGVATELIGGTYTWANDTYAPAYNPPILMGTPAPTATGAVDTHYDNIHNHRVETP